MLPLLWLGLLAGLAVVPSGSTAWADDAPDLSSTNLDCVANFLARAEAATGTVTVVAFGDSLQYPPRSIGRYLFGLMQERLGFAGIVFAGQVPTLAKVEMGGGAYTQAPDGIWWMDHTVLPAGGYITWSNRTYAMGSLPADSVGVYHVAGPAAGEFSISLSTNGGPWGEIARVDAWASAPEGRFAGFPVESGYYRLRVDALGGTHRILGPELVQSGSTGIRTAYLYKGGVDLNQIMGVDPAVQEPILDAIRPDLVVWHMKELGDINAGDLSNRLNQLEALWRDIAPEADVVYIGTPYRNLDTNSSHTATQNTIVRDVALRHERAYIDCMTPFVSFEYMVTNGYLDDGVHPSNKCNEEMADIVWSELGLYALRVDRRLDVERSGNALVVSCPTTHDLRYVLESSTNLLEWVAVTNAAGDGSMLVVTNQAPAEDSEVYRLRLEE